MVKLIAAVCFVGLIVSGCAEFDVPTPKSVLEQPLGTDSIRIGMTKDKVVDLWGEPDFVDYEEDEASGRSREVWTYKGRYSAVPVDADYLSRTKVLYFDGNNVTSVQNR